MPKRSLTISARVLFWLLAVAAVGARSAPLWGQEKNFLWKASGETNTVYILGSVHLLKRESAALKPIFEEVFSKSRRLVLEIDLVKEGPAKFQQLLMQKGVNLDGTSLQRQLSPETYELAAQRAADLGVDLKLMA